MGTVIAPQPIPGTGALLIALGLLSTLAGLSFLRVSRRQSGVR
jgi:hypothetical protein